MEKDRSLARNVLYSAASSASNVLLIVLIIVAARTLGDSSFGHFSFALAVATILEMITDLGLNTLTARNVSRDRGLAGIYLPNILGWKLVLSALAVVILAGTIGLLSRPGDARIAAYMLLGAIILRSYKATSHAFFQAYERFDLILLTTYVERVSVLVVGVIALVLTRSVVAFAMTFMLARIPDLLLSYWILHRKVARVRIALKPDVVKKLQISALPFGSYFLVLAAYWQVGTIILSQMRPAAEVGWYNASYKIYEGLTMVPFLLGAVLLPRLSRLFTVDKEAHKALSLRVLRYLLLGALPVVISVGMVAPDGIRLLYGSEYLAAIPILRVLLGAATLMFINWTLNMVLMSADREKLVLQVITCGLVVMAVSNLALIPGFGAIGAAYAVAASEMSVFLLLLVAMRRVLFPVPAHKIAWRPVVACLPAGAVLLLPGVVTSALAAIFLALYAAVLLALRTFGAEDWSTLKSLLPSRGTHLS